MKIYTSYFANVKALNSANIFAVGITRFPPKWFHGININTVAPSEQLLLDIKSGRIDKAEYKKRYLDELSKIDLNNFIQTLYDIPIHNMDIALCCYEKPTDFCHRHILAAKLSEIIKQDVHEYSGCNTLW